MQTLSNLICNLYQSVRKLKFGIFQTISILKQKLSEFCLNINKLFNCYSVCLKCNSTVLRCGLCSIVAVKKKNKNSNLADLADLADLFKISYFIISQAHSPIINSKKKIISNYLGGKKIIENLFRKVKMLKINAIFLSTFNSKKKQNDLILLSKNLSKTLRKEQRFLKEKNNNIDNYKMSLMIKRLEILEDIIWCIDNELIKTFKKIENLLPWQKTDCPDHVILFFRRINTVLNSIDKLEVRGRDSAGISIFFILSLSSFKKLIVKLKQKKLSDEFNQRQLENLLTHKNIDCNYSMSSTNPTVTITITYKIASEIGSLGDNTKFLRNDIKNDLILPYISSFSPTYNTTITAHTRWASVGAITEPNCHPIDNKFQNKTSKKGHIIHVCLNGEIDNYLELKTECEAKGTKIQNEITTDTKVIPAKIEEYLDKGHDIISAFRLALNTFQGSHAIIMQTDLAPGKLLIAQKGSGQAMFIGLSENGYIATSEVYGFVEETNKFLKMKGDEIKHDKLGNKIQGQIFILTQESEGKAKNIQAMCYDGTPIKIDESDIKFTTLTSKDIDRKGFKHYFLKEIYEAPLSVEKTLNGKWNLEKHKNTDCYYLKLSEKILPESIQNALKKNSINQIFFIGQGTAGIAAQACSNILKYFLNGDSIQTKSLRASEFSGFELCAQKKNNLENTLVIAITQSGTTTDTNRSIEMAQIRNAHTVAIVNRRDSDITFKVDGSIYTSNGRDIEMSVASTKAFYSQITAGTILCLQIAYLTKSRTEKFISNQIKKLLEIPTQMRKVLNMENDIKKSARKLSTIKQNWAIAGSGPNKAAANEIRIKLSELCYRTISSDFIEDKKHIDLSSEPLILVCAAGLSNKVIKDIVKDTAIFKAHKAIPIVIADEGEKRFKSYAADIFYVPKIDQHFAPLLNTLVGHLWGYHAALSLNETSDILSKFRKSIQKNIDIYTANGSDAFEIIRKKSFMNKVNKFYRRLRSKMRDPKQPLHISNSTDIILLLKHLSGRLPVSDFEVDFGEKGTAIRMLKLFFKIIDKSINNMSRPIDAIKHQAKTVTVGTSRISSNVNGILFEVAKTHRIKISQLANKNVAIMKNLQKIINRIQGSILYTIAKLDSLGEPTYLTEIMVHSKSGILKSKSSRVENDNKLKGIKRIVVSRGDIYVGKGQIEGQNVIIIPAYSNAPLKFDKIRYLLLLDVTFKNPVPLEIKIKALGGKYDNIKSIVHENSIMWNDEYLNNIEMDDLFGFSAEKTGEHIVSQQRYLANKFTIDN